MTTAPKRSVRQRTATKQFEYRQPPEGVPDTKGSKTIDRHVQVGVGDKEHLAADDQAAHEKQAKPLTRGRGPADTSRQSTESDIGSPPRKRARLQESSRTSDFVIWSDSEDDSRSDGQTFSSDHGTEDTKETTPPPPPTRKPALQTGKSAVVDDPFNDLYPDSYQRHIPDIRSYDIWRRENLETLIHNKGLTGIQAQSIASWLHLCEIVGLHPYGSSPARKGRKASSSSRRGSTKPASNRGRKISKFGPKDELGSQDDENDRDSLLDAGTDNGSMISSVAPGSIITDQQALFENVPETISQVPTTETSVRDEDLSDDEESHEIEEQKNRIQAQLNIFNFVYGENGLKPDPKKWEDKLDYLSPMTKRPRSVPKGGFRTQGHSRLQLVTLPANDPALFNNIITPASYAHLPKNALNHGLNFNQTVPHSRQVLTEDPNFGITRFPPEQTETPEGLKAFNEERRSKHRSRQEMANDQSKTKEEIREEEAEAAEAEYKRAKKELATRRWDWETPDAMKGYWVDVEAGQTRFDPTKFASGVIDETWKRGRARM